MNLIKTSLYTSISQAISILSGLVAVKVISSKIGPSGIALTGQFANTTSLLTLIASATVSIGVVKYLAEYRENKDLQFKVIRTSFWLTLICSIAVGFFTVAFSDKLSLEAFKTANYNLVYVLWGSFLVISTLGSLSSAILNGLKLIKYLTIINISTTIIGLGFTIILAHYYGVVGVLISSNFTALTLFILHLFFLHKYRWFKWRDFLDGMDKKILKLFSGFMLMALVSGLLIPTIQLIVRNKIINDFSFEDAGYWQSVTRISDYYLGFITSVLSIYYLPRLSEIKDKNELKAEVLNGYKIILPVVGILSFIIWLGRFIIIKILLTPEFAPSAQLYGFQFLGDFFKIAAWLLAYLMLARGLKITFIVSEILYSFIYVALCFFFLNKFGIIGAAYGFFASYLLYFIAVFIVIKKQKII